MTKTFFLVYLLVFFGGRGVKLDIPCVINFFNSTVNNWKRFELPGIYSLSPQGTQHIDQL